jgi:alkylation response protein AidB-like acyl-CoA dehydrogenase
MESSMPLSDTPRTTGADTVDHEEILRRVREISPKLREGAAKSDELRHVHPESIRLMIDAGMFRITAPRRTGGYELTLRSHVAAVTGLSQACPSSGWVLMVMNAHHWCIGCFPQDGQDDVFGDGRDGMVAGTLSWQGFAKPADGGYRVSGRWQFCSGVDHSDWIMLGCADPDSYRPRVHVVVPKDALEIDDTWHVMGLQGTGSKDVVAHDVFVPAKHAVGTRELFNGTSAEAARHPTNLYRLSAEAMLAMSVSSAVLGSAKLALGQFEERTKQRKVILTGASKAEHAPTQIRAAEAAGEIRCAHLLQQDVLDEFDELMASGERFDVAHRVRAKFQAAYAAELCRRAVGRLFSGSGAHSVYAPSLLQRAFRNVNVGAQHASIDFDSSAEQWGRIRLGVKD